MPPFADLSAAAPNTEPAPINVFNVLGGAWYMVLPRLAVGAALAGLGGGNGGNLIHPSSVEAVTGGVLRAALGWSFCTLGADGPGRGGNCTHSSLLADCERARQAAASSEPIRHDLKCGERKAVNRDGLKRSKKTFRAGRTNTENKIS